MNTAPIFSHYVHVKNLVLGSAQFVWFATAMYLSALVRFLGESVPLTADFQVVLPKTLIYAAILTVTMGALGIYHPQNRDGHLQVVMRVLVSFVLAGLALVFLFYLFPSLYLGRGILAIALLLSFLGSLALQLTFYVLIDRRGAPWRVLFYGAGENAASILAYLRRRSDQRLFALIGCIELEGEKTQVADRLVHRLDQPLRDYVRANKIDEVVVVMDDQRRNFPDDELLSCRVAGTHISDTLTFYERQTGKIRTELLRPSWIIFSHGFRPIPLQDKLKRGMDLICALVLLIVFSPLMLLTALAILFEGSWREPIFFSQNRVGIKGEVFTLYKFRSMGTDAEAEGEAQWASRDDPRVTRVGRHIRKYRLDELPQLFNVIQGNMSLVGPRPERPEFVEQLVRKLPYYRVREQVKPGITGWAQLGYPYGASEEDANSKLELDLYYVKNRSIFLDLIILLGTVEVMLFRKGGR